MTDIAQHNQIEDAPLTEEQLIYKENILDHYRHPHNTGRLENADISHRELNTSCGDDVRIYVKLDNGGAIREIRFDGRGCAISQAAVSMLTDHVQGMAADEIMKLGQSDVTKLLGVPIGPMRSKCATLGLKTLQKGFETHLAKN